MIIIPSAVAPRLEAPLCTNRQCPDRMTLWTGCTACVGWRCECGEGCDIDTRSDSGLCATATDTNRDEEKTA